MEEEAHEEVEAQKAKDEGKVGYHVVWSWYLYLIYYDENAANKNV